jgi:hypothetical protein
VLTDFFHNLADLVLFSVVIWAQWGIGSSILAKSKSRSTRIAGVIRLLVVVFVLWLAVGFALAFN